MDRQIHSDVTGKFLRIEHDQDPECGKDFCDHCGDCLGCYGGDDCVQGNNGHIWVRYEKEGSNLEPQQRQPIGAGGEG